MQALQNSRVLDVVHVEFCFTGSRGLYQTSKIIVVVKIFLATRNRLISLILPPSKFEPLSCRRVNVFIIFYQFIPSKSLRFG